MTIVRSTTSANFLGRHTLLSNFRTRCIHNPSRCPEASTFKHMLYVSTDQKASQSNIQARIRSELPDEMEKSQQAQDPHPSNPKFPSWVKWAIGSILSQLLPFWKRQWEKFLQIEGEVEKVAETVESAADVVEAVAEVTQKVTSEVADKLPEEGKLKNAVTLVEEGSKEAAKDAHLAKEFIHKVCLC